MQAAFGTSFVFCCALGLVGCGSDSKASTAPAASSGAAGDATSVPSGAGGSGTGAGGDTTGPLGDKCHDGCIETLAAKCSHGPADQASCESTCHSLETGTCGAEYATFQSCAEGKALSCNAQGIPIVAACSDEQTAFVTCLNQ
ncbi:MAG TPA: hypothetical protein VNG33_04090 [Polyangiaceae bacterium]|nr:hypothetical protein [Polyangiaceae bacterium]